MKTKQPRRAKYQQSFLNILSHQLRTPAYSIRDALNILSYHRELPAKLKNIVSIAKRKCNQMTSLLENLLKITDSKIESMSNEQHKPVFLNDLINKVIKNNLTEAEKKDISIETNFSNGRLKCYLSSNKGLLEQTLQNLISNSIQYGKSNSKVTVKTKLSKKQLEILVKDKGPGIPLKEQPLLFTPFYRTSNSKQVNPFGTGLGLTIAKLFTEKLGGKIGIVSKKNKGSKFWVRLPVVKKDTKGTVYTGGVKLNKILLVEDDNDYAELLSLSLSNAGYSVETANDIKEAYSKSNYFHPDLILLDVMLPDGNGYDFCNQLYPKYPDLPIIMLSAVRQSDEDKILGLECGAIDYILKSCSHKELIARIKRVLIKQQEPPDKSKISLRLTEDSFLTINLLRQKAEFNNKTLLLTSTEFKLLYTFVENVNKILTRNAILKLIWEYEPKESETLKVHIYRLRKKLLKFISKELCDIVAARGTGYMLIVKEAIKSSTDTEFEKIKEVYPPPKKISIK